MSLSRRKFIRLSSLGFASTMLFGCGSDGPDYDLSLTDGSENNGSGNNGYGNNGSGGETGNLNLSAAPFIIPNFNDGDTAARFAAIGDVHANCSLLDGMLSKCENEKIDTVLLIGDSVENFYLKNSDGSLIYEDYEEGQAQAYKEYLMDQKQWNDRLDIYPTRGNHCVKMDHQVVTGPLGKTVLVEGNDGYIEMQKQWHTSIGQYLNNKELIKPGDYYSYLNPTDILTEKLQALVDEGLHDDVSKLYAPATYAFIKDQTLFFSLDSQFTMGWATLDRSQITNKMIKAYLATDQNILNNAYRDLGNAPFDPIVETSEGQPVYIGCEWILLLDFMKNVTKDYQGQFKNIVTFYHFPMCGRDHAGQFHNISPTSFLSSGNSPMLIEKATELVIPLLTGIFSGTGNLDLGDYTVADLINLLEQMGYDVTGFLDDYGQLIETMLPKFMNLLRSVLADFDIVIPEGIETYAAGFTKEMLSFFAENNIVHLCGHDHIFAKSNMYAVDVDTIKDPANGVDFSPYAIAEKNMQGALATDLSFNQTPSFKAFTVDSGSHKHYTTHYAFSAPGFEVPLLGQSTNRGINGGDTSDAVVNGMMIGEFRGDLLSLIEIGNEHQGWTNDGFLDYVAGDISESELHQIDVTNWQPISSTLVFNNATNLIIPAKFSYQTQAMVSENKTTAQILAGDNLTFNTCVGTVAGRLGEQTLAYAEEVNMMWLGSENDAVLSDVLFIEGMMEQNGAEFDDNGNVQNGLDWYIAEEQATDPFTLSMQIEGTLPDTAQLAIYDEVAQIWQALNASRTDSGFEVENCTQNGFFAIVDFDLLSQAEELPEAV